MIDINWTEFFANFKTLASTAVGIAVALVLIIAILVWLYFVISAPIKLSNMLKTQTLLLKEIRKLSDYQVETHDALIHLNKHICRDHDCKQYDHEENN